MQNICLLLNAEKIKKERKEASNVPFKNVLLCRDKTFSKQAPVLANHFITSLQKCILS